MRRSVLLSTRNPCGEILFEGPVAAARCGIEEHPLASSETLGIRVEDGVGFFPGRMVVQRRKTFDTYFARCGTIVAVSDGRLAVLWGGWLPDPGPDAGLVAGIMHTSRAIKALGEQCARAEQERALFIKAHRPR